jgi:hypothetical protein
MAGIEFNRQSLVRSRQPHRGSMMPVIRQLIVILASGGAGYLSFKSIICGAWDSRDGTETQDLCPGSGDGPWISS